MKRLSFILCAVIFSASLKAQTIGSLHNAALDSILLKFENSPATFDRLYDYVAEYAARRAAVIPSRSSVKAYAVQFVINKGYSEMLRAARSANLVSPQVMTYMEKVTAEAERLGDPGPEGMYKLLTTMASSREYVILSRTDKTIAANFNDALGKSYELWSTNDTRRKCGVKCFICMALVDAFWTSIPPPNPILGAIMSAISRCCGCGSCSGNVNCNFT